MSRRSASKPEPDHAAGAPPAADWVVAVIRDHAAGLLAIARRYSFCIDDAHDAYQRAIEIFLRRAADVERTTAASWLRTVVKNEALAVRAARQTTVSRGDPNLDLHEAPELPDEDERIARFERLDRAAEALQRLKPHEITALVLRAEGHSYREICERTGWTYTKVNRCITEGRRSFLARYADIESGAECERFAPLLSAMADGEASARDVLRLRPHLRGCPACRATLREHRSIGRGIAALVPLGALAAAGAASAQRPAGLLLRAYEALTGGVHERAAGSAAKVQSAVDVASSGKLAAIAASTAALAGGGVAVEHELASAPRGAHRAAHRQRADLDRHTPAHAQPVLDLSAEHTPPAATRRLPPVTAPVSTPRAVAPVVRAAPVTASPAPAPAATQPARPSQEFAPEQAAGTPAPSSSSSGSTPRSAPSPQRSARSSSGSSSSEFGP